jgi:hypothetical protein
MSVPRLCWSRLLLRYRRTPLGASPRTYPDPASSAPTHHPTTRGRRPSCLVALTTRLRGQLYKGRSQCLALSATAFWCRGAVMARARAGRVWAAVGPHRRRPIQAAVACQTHRLIEAVVVVVASGCLSLSGSLPEQSRDCGWRLLRSTCARWAGIGRAEGIRRCIAVQLQNARSKGGLGHATKVCEHHRPPRPRPRESEVNTLGALTTASLLRQTRP